MPFFSVIIPNYNHAAYLEQRIHSVLKQSFKDFEVIVLDDASTDNSTALIQKYPSIIKVVNEKNSGSPFRQWEKGAALAKGEWLWFAESDDLASPAFLQTMYDVIQKNKTAGLIYCDAMI